MQITLTPAQAAIVEDALRTGRSPRAEDVVQEALLLWAERENARADLLAELDAADASIDRGEGTPLTPESMQDLAADVKRRGRERLAAEQKSSA